MIYISLDREWKYELRPNKCSQYPSRKHVEKNMVDLSKCKLFLVVFLLIEMLTKTVFLFVGCFVVMFLFIYVQETTIHLEIEKNRLFFWCYQQNAVVLSLQPMLCKKTQNQIWKSEIQCCTLPQRSCGIWQIQSIPTHSVKEKMHCCNCSHWTRHSTRTT